MSQLYKAEWNLSLFMLSDKKDGTIIRKLIAKEETSHRVRDLTGAHTLFWAELKMSYKSMLSIFCFALSLSSLNLDLFTLALMKI